MKKSEEENSLPWKLDTYVHCKGHKEQQKRKISDTGFWISDTPRFYIGIAISTKKDSNRRQCPTMD